MKTRHILLLAGVVLVLLGVGAYLIASRHYEAKIDSAALDNVPQGLEKLGYDKWETETKDLRESEDRWILGAGVTAILGFAFLFGYLVTLLRRFLLWAYAPALTAAGILLTLWLSIFSVPTFRHLGRRDIWGREIIRIGGGKVDWGEGVVVPMLLLGVGWFICVVVWMLALRAWRKRWTGRAIPGK